jgi:sulfide:quinone oxidoreductase
LDTKPLTATLSVAAQITPQDLKALREAGFRSVICNRPDGEGADQPSFDEIARAAHEQGLHCRYLPAESGKVTDAQAADFGALMAELPRPVLAYCRTGMRSTTMWALSQAAEPPLAQIIERAAGAGYDLKGVVRRIVNGGKTPVEMADASHDGRHHRRRRGRHRGGQPACWRAARPGHRHHRPADIHYYQPGWTLVGGGVFKPGTTARTMASVLPQGVHWIKSAVAAFEPERNAVILDGCRVVQVQAAGGVPRASSSTGMASRA